MAGSHMQSIVAELCSERCAGRRSGTAEGQAARQVVTRAFEQAGLEPAVQPIGSTAANVWAAIPGKTNRWVLVGAHFDHLGTQSGLVYPGADDNAAGVAILVELARIFAASRPGRRGLLFAAFDAEEPPNFAEPTMGSEQFARAPPVPLPTLDLMVCLDLVGHAVGPPGLPSEVGSTLFAIGAERSEGTALRIDEIAEATRGLVVRRLDAELMPPLSDYAPFWRRAVPFLFLTAGRSRHYHSPEDTPERLDFGKMGAITRWLELFLRQVCASKEPRLRFLRHREDASTLKSLRALADALPGDPFVRNLVDKADRLLRSCRSDGSLPPERLEEQQLLALALEGRLA